MLDIVERLVELPGIDVDAGDLAIASSAHRPNLGVQRCIEQPHVVAQRCHRYFCPGRASIEESEGIRTVVIDYAI